MSYVDALVTLVLTLLVLRYQWWLFFEPLREPGRDDPRPRLAARDRTEYVQLRKAMMPDELPIPPDDGIEEVHLDSLWNRRN